MDCRYLYHFLRQIIITTVVLFHAKVNQTATCLCNIILLGIKGFTYFAKSDHPKNQQTERVDQPEQITVSS